MIYEGVVKKVLPEEQVGKNNMRKRTIILEEITDKDRKGGLAVDFLKDKCDLVQDVQVGDKIKVHLNLRVNEYKGRWYNSITCWKLEKIGPGGSNTTDDGGADGFQPNEYDDELPF